MEDHIINNEFNHNISNIPNETIINHQDENIQQPPQMEINQHIQEEIQQPQEFGNHTIAEEEMRDEVAELNTAHQENPSNEINQQVGEVSNVNETGDTLDNNETNDALMEQIMESENAAMKDDDMETTVDTDNQGTGEENVNRTIEENVGENDQLNQSNFENVVIPSEIPAPVPTVSVQTTNTNKRQLDLEIEQLAKHRKLLEEERRKIEEQISILENEEMNYEEPPELTLSQCTAIITRLKKIHEGIIWPFLEPVDPVKLGIPQYPEIIKNPMDIGTISAKLKRKDYASYLGFVADMNLVWDNAILFNGETDIGRWAVDLKEATRSLVEEGLKKKAQDKKKSVGVQKAPPKVTNQVDEIKKFIELVRHDPSTLSQPKYQFFTEFVSRLDIKK